MPNFFDQFDSQAAPPPAAPPTGGGNFFDQFDSTTQPSPTASPAAPVASQAPGVAGQPQTPAGDSPGVLGVLSKIVPGIGIGKSIYDGATGAKRTEFPDAPEFAPAYMKATGGKLGEGTTAVERSAVTPDQQAQLDIIKKHVPGIQTKTDAHGNLMLRSPEMTDWAYLNKPGLSERDLDEFGTQTLATLPLLGMWGRGATTLARVGSAAGAAAGSSVTEDALATAAGSDQGISPENAAISAGLGAVTAPGVPSAIASGVARGTQAAVAPLANIVRGAVAPEAQAARNVVGALARDSGAPDTITGQQLDALTRNRLSTAEQVQDPRIMDAGGETTRALTRSAANVSPEARETVMDVIQPRYETQAHRSVEALRTIAGTPGNATAIQQGIETIADHVNPPLYRAAYQAGSQGITSPALARLAAAPAVDEAMERAGEQMANRQAIGRVQTAINGPNGHPTLEMWDQVTRSLSDEENVLRSRGRMEEAANIGGLRTAIQGELDNQVPEFRQARGAAATFFGASDALDAGRRVATGAFGAADARDTVGQRIGTGRWTPDQIDAARARMTPSEQRMFREGYVSSWVDKLNAAGDNRNVVSLLNGNPKVRDEMEAVLGPNRSRQLQAFMNAERMIDRVRGAVTGNSTTARQLAEIGLATTAGAAVNGFDPQDPTGWIVGFLTYKGLHRGMATVDRRVAEATARMLTADDPSVFQRGLSQLAHSPMLRSLQAADLALSRPARALAVKQLTPRDDKGAAQ